VTGAGVEVQQFHAAVHEGVALEASAIEAAAHRDAFGVAALDEIPPHCAARAADAERCWPAAESFVFGIHAAIAAQSVVLDEHVMQRGQVSEACGEATLRAAYDFVATQGGVGLAPYADAPFRQRCFAFWPMNIGLFLFVRL